MGAVTEPTSFYTNSLHWVVFLGSGSIVPVMVGLVWFLS